MRLCRDRLQGHELSDVRRHHNDALERLKQQSDTLLHLLNLQRNRGSADDSVLEQASALGGRASTAHRALLASQSVPSD